jgi:outer membrane lipoprotein-sorting protein
LKNWAFITIFFFFLITIETGLAEEVESVELISQMRSEYARINDYQCRLEESCTGGSRFEKRIINYYFKKPKKIRMDILQGNRPFDDGSVAVYLGSGKVAGHRGGILKSLVLRLDKTHPLATTVRGLPIDESDMETVLRRFDFYLEKGIIELREREGMYEFTCFPLNTDENGGITRDIVLIDRTLLLIVGNERYENDKLVQQARWSRWILNAGLPDALFDVRFEFTDLLELGIPTLDHELDNHGQKESD